MPRPPSMEAISAVSSPQTKAPAPMRTSISKPKLLSAILGPSSPACSAWRMAVVSRFTASGYSART